MQHLPSNLQKRHSTASLFPTKRAPKQQKMYALRVATRPGIYNDWTVAKQLIDGCPGAKYKGFYSLQECIQFVWEQFPDATFTKNEDGDYIMDNPEPVMAIIEQARQKKQKNLGVVMGRDDSPKEQESDWQRLRNQYQQDQRLNLTLNQEQAVYFQWTKENKNPYSGKGVLLAHILNHFSTLGKNVISISCSAIKSLNGDKPFSIGWTGMGKALGTKKQLVAKVRKNPVARKAWADTDVLVFEDASMLSSFLLENMDFLAREIKRSNAPFGGIQLVFVGDLMANGPGINQTTCCPHCGQSIRITGSSALQVPPNALVPGGIIICQNPQCQKPYHNTWILYGFQAPCWDRLQVHYCPLTMNYGPDLEMAQLWRACQSGSPELSQLVSSRKCIRICGTEEEASLLNSSKFAGLPHEQQVKYECSDTVLNNFDFSARSQQKEGIAEEQLLLKTGLDVIVVSEDGSNGLLGQIVGFRALHDDEKRMIAVKLAKGTPVIEESVHQWLRKNGEVPLVKIYATEQVQAVHCRIWAVNAYGKVTAWRIQLPLRQGYAISISGTNKWAPGQCYQALAIVSRIQNLFIENLNPENFFADPRVTTLLAGLGPGGILKSVPPPVLPEAIPMGSLGPGFQMIHVNMPELERRGSFVSTASSEMMPPLNRRASVMSTSSSVDFDVENSASIPSKREDLRPMFLQRRHSFQPVTPFQEQQYQWLASNQPEAYLSMSQHLQPPSMFAKYSTFDPMGRETTPKRRKTNTDLPTPEYHDSLLNQPAPQQITRMDSIHEFSNFSPMNPDYVMERRPSLISERKNSFTDEILGITSQLSLGPNWPNPQMDLFQKEQSQNEIIQQFFGDPSAQLFQNPQ
ncbi:hypothetical protein EDD86DRAFT_245302 [Gorgonomyces haynaldii]|nr:hypothetical protein EDD86DRAFT_245302 [Gorgonomyces haynaldii]